MRRLFKPARVNHLKRGIVYLLKQFMVFYQCLHQFGVAVLAILHSRVYYRPGVRMYSLCLLALSTGLIFCFYIHPNLFLLVLSCWFFSRLVWHQGNAMHTIRYWYIHESAWDKYMGIPLYQMHIDGGVCLVSDKYGPLTHCVTPVFAHYSTHGGGNK